MFYNLFVMGDWQDKGQRLRELRNKKGWSVRGLAREMGVSKSTVSDVELGRRKPTANYLIKAAKTLGIAERAAGVVWLSGASASRFRPEIRTGGSRV